MYSENSAEETRQQLASKASVCVLPTLQLVPEAQHAYSFEEEENLDHRNPPRVVCPEQQKENEGSRECTDDVQSRPGPEITLAAFQDAPLKPHESPLTAMYLVGSAGTEERFRRRNRIANSAAQDWSQEDAPSSYNAKTFTGIASVVITSHSPDYDDLRCPILPHTRTV